MVLTVVEDRTVDVIVPSTFDSKMKLRAVAFFVEAVCTVDLVVLVDPLESPLADGSAQRDLLPFEGGHVEIDPVPDGVFGELQGPFALEFAAGVQINDVHPCLAADRDVEIVFGDFKLNG